jgi:hypothetical protein
MNNGAAVRISEHRHCAVSRDTFRVDGTQGSYQSGQWFEKTSGESGRSLTPDEMRDPLPAEVYEANQNMTSEPYGGHGGSHAYLVHEFVTAVVEERRPAIDVWTAARYMAAGVAAHRSALRKGELVAVPDLGQAAEG